MLSNIIIKILMYLCEAERSVTVYLAWDRDDLIKNLFAVVFSIISKNISCFVFIIILAC